MLKIESHVLLPSFETDTWLLWDDESKEALVADPSAPSQELLLRLGELGLSLKYIFITHGHADHIGGIGFFKEKHPAPVVVHPADAPMLTDAKKNFSEYMGFPLTAPEGEIMAEDGTELKLGTHTLRVIHTPGHTRGGICLLADKFLISGDTLFELSIGRTDFPGGSHSQIIDSIKQKLFTLPNDVIVFPGHGPRTSIGLEKKNNPFVR